MNFPLAMNLNPSTVARVITDLVDSLAHHKILKCVLLNGHGGNDLKWLLRELYGKTPVQLFLCNWWKVGVDRYSSIYEDAGDHAGELETSLMLSLRPDLVQMDLADDGSMARTRFEAISKGWVEMTRPWHLLTTNSGAGNPHPSTAAKGEATIELVVERIGTFLAELSRTPIDASFPYPPKSE
jgi:creatinine amidohydrolase